MIVKSFWKTFQTISAHKESTHCLGLQKISISWHWSFKSVLWITVPDLDLRGTAPTPDLAPAVFVQFFCLIEGSWPRSGSVQINTDQDPGGPKTYGSGSGTPPLAQRKAVHSKRFQSFRQSRWQFGVLFLITTVYSTCSRRGIIVYIEYQIVFPLVGIGSPSASQCVCPLGTKGGRSPNSDDWKKPASLYTLCL
jgi:hypothetical protein